MLHGALYVPFYIISCKWLYILTYFTSTHPFLFPLSHSLLFQSHSTPPAVTMSCLNLYLYFVHLLISGREWLAIEVELNLINDPDARNVSRIIRTGSKYCQRWMAVKGGNNFVSHTINHFDRNRWLRGLNIWKSTLLRFRSIEIDPGERLRNSRAMVIACFWVIEMSIFSLVLFADSDPTVWN